MDGRISLAAIALFCAFASAGLGAGVKGDLGGGIAVEADDAGGVVFRAGERTLSFAPFRHVAAKGGAAPRLSYRIDGDALVVDVDGDAGRFGVLSFGRCSERPAGLYFGYGYYVESPARLNVPLNGHQNATRFAGFEFPCGLSLVVATTTPPDSLYVDESGDSFGFRLSQPTSLTFLPGRAGAFDCALRYRRHVKTPAPSGFAAKAGRFAVDTWNGTFAQQERLLRRCADEYGVSDALLYVHCWQRHGFDRRLPEVYPPSPTFGTAADLKRLCASAREKGWCFGVHLNVIDCYPESPWFDWKRICHHRNPKTDALEPIKAWINPPHGDQSYRLLPRHGAESIRYQIAQMHADGFCPDTVFIDVTGSGPNLAGTCLDSEGRVHTLVENCAGNAAMFDAARAAVDGRSPSALPAFVSSEAPADYMAGHLEGGDCQWMFLTREPGAYRWMTVGGSGRIEKTPWLPLVHHDRMSLHGVGYSARFEGARGEDCHGIDSDDYLTCEIMNGHSLMADCYNRDAYKAEAGILEPIDETRCLRQIVRKYWLAQHVVREIAEATVSEIAFCDETRARLRIRWSTGMTVFVNRAMSDWRVPADVPGRGEVVLPPYGFVAFNPATERYAAVLRLGGRVVEESRHVEGARTYRYANARGSVANDGRLPLAPQSEVSQSNGVFGVRTSWRLFTGQTVPQGKFRVDWWLLDPKFREYSPKEAAVRVASAVVPLDRAAEASFAWPAAATGARVLHVSVSPAGAEADDVAARFKLLGTAAFYKRYRQGTFAKDSRAYAPYVCPDEPLWERLFAPAGPVDFGWTKTRGAFRVVSGPGARDVRTDLP